MVFLEESIEKQMLSLLPKTLRLLKRAIFSNVYLRNPAADLFLHFFLPFPDTHVSFGMHS